MFKQKKKGLIIVHPNCEGKVNFDIFGRIPRKLKRIFGDTVGYFNLDCEYVDMFNSRDFPYIFSEDLSHIKSGNGIVQTFINNLITEGFEVRFVDWDDIGEKEGK